MTVDEVNELVEEIQRLLGASMDPMEEELIDLAARHDEIVEAVRVRLREVEQLLNKGLRAEAIELAEQAPNLNDLVTALDFPEIEVWNDYLSEWDIQTVRDLPVDVAAELNDAYSLSKPLQRLLARYRKESLARVPLDQRIATLKELCAEDRDNTGWRSDLKKFETHRLGVLKKKLQLAIKAGDLSQSAVIDQEMSAGDWSINVPASLRQAARKSHIQLRQISAREELKTLCQDFSDAFADFDKSKAIPLRDRFRALAEILDLDEADPCYDIVGPALDWLDDEGAKSTADADFAESVAQLEAALEQTTSIDELERRYHRTVRHGHSLPELLEKRLANRTEAIRSAERRKRNTILIMIAGFCLLSVTGLVMTVQHFTFQNAVAGHFQQAEDLLKDSVSSGNFQPIDAYFATINAEDSRFLLQPELAGLKEKLELARNEELGREARLDRFVDDALTIATGKPRWEQLAQAEQSLQSAEEITLNSAEKARILGAASTVREVRAEMQKQADDAFLASQAEIVDQIAELPMDSVQGYPQVQNRIAELQSREYVSSELKTALSALKMKVGQQQALVQANLDIARDLKRLTRSVGQTKDYTSALLTYTKAHPGTARTEDFQSLLQTDVKLWEGVDTWNALRHRFVDLSLTSITPDDAATLKKEFNQFEQSSGPYPGKTLVAEWVTALGAIAARSQSDRGTSMEQIARMFAPKTISLAYQLKTKEGLRYFTTEPPTVKRSRVTFDFFLTPTGTSLENKILRSSEIPGDRSRTRIQWLSPQTTMTQRIQPELNKRLETDFEDAIAFGVEAIYEEAKVDSILRLFLIDKLLQTGADGSLFIGRRVKTHLEAIATAGVSRLTNWASPDQSLAEEDRARATEFLKGIGAVMLNDLQSAVTDRNKAAEQQIGPAMKCVGFLRRDVKSQWVVALRYELTVSEQTDLFAFGHTAGGPRFNVVASIAETAVGMIPASVAPSGKEGQLIYRAIP